MKKYLAKLDWNNTLSNKTATECRNILTYEIESIIEQFVSLKKKQGKRSRKKHLSKEVIKKIIYKQTTYVCGGFIGVPERMKTTQITKRHLMQL